MKLAAGSIIFRQGEASDVAYMIESGSVEILRELQGGGTERLAVLHAGQMFGEMGPMDAAPRSATARVLSDAVLTPFEVDAE